MKKFLALVLALLMALSCFSFAGAEGEGAGETTTEPVCTTHTFVDAANEPAGKPAADTAPTCKNPGTAYKYCSVCKQWIATTVPATGNHEAATDSHDYTVTYLCRNGYELWNSKCAFCGEKFLKESHLEPVVHTWDDTKTVVVPETCTSEGYTQKTCKVCGKTEKMDIVPKHTASKWGTVDGYYDEANKIMTYALVDGQGAADPTCETVGITGAVKMCSKCHNIPKKWFDGVKWHDNYNAEIPVVKHTDSDLFATYKEDYNNKTYLSMDPADMAKIYNNFGLTAKDFEADFTKTVDGSKLNFTDSEGKPYHYGKTLTVTYKAPKWHEEDGSITFTCSCGYTKTVAVYAGHHTYFLNRIEYVSADHQRVQYKGEWKEIHLGDDVDWKFVLNEVNPYDCTIPFVAVYVCDCGKEISIEDPATNFEHEWEVVNYDWVDFNGYKHTNTYGQWEDIPEDYDGQTVPMCAAYTVNYQCRYCNQTKSEDKPAHETKHKMVATDIKRDSTCTVAGMVMKSCEYGCGYNEITTLPLADHTPDSSMTKIVNATCTTEGTATYTCANCGTTWTEKIPKLSADGKHKYVKKIDVAATCTKPGKGHMECKLCGDKNGETFEIPASHVALWDNLVPNSKYTNIKNVGGKIVWDDCTKEGHYSFKCANCCKTFNVSKDAGTHDWEFVNDTKKTSTDFEYIDDKTCRLHYVENYKCTVCGKEKAEKKTIDVAHEPTMDHDNEGNEWPHVVEIVKEATCENKGTAVYECAHCHKNYVGELEAIGHHYVPTWDKAAKKWVYTCDRDNCNSTKEFKFENPSYTVDTTGIKKGARTTGTGKLVMDETLIPTINNVYVYIRWTYTLRDGDDFIFEDVRTVNDDLTFSAKGPTAPAGSTLTKVTIIATNDPAADDKDYDSMVKYGYTIMK